MSDNGSCATDDIVSCVVDSERLIAEVEKRPALYNRKLKEYSDRNLKEKLWGEVCCSLIRNWTELSGPEKNNKGISWFSYFINSCRHQDYNNLNFVILPRY